MRLPNEPVDAAWAQPVGQRARGAGLEQAAGAAGIAAFAHGVLGSDPQRVAAPQRW